MATNRILQLLRSKALYESLDAAKIAIRQIDTASDGEVRLARYQTSEGVKSLLCVYHTNENFDPALQGTITNMPGWTFIEDAQSGADGINALQTELDNLEAQVGQNGESETFASGASGEAAQVLTGAQDNTGSAPTNLTNAVTKVATYITTLDKTADVQNGQVVTTVTQTNGQVAETKANVKDLQLGGYSKDANASGAIGGADTVNTALSKLENAIAANAVVSEDGSIDVNTGTNGDTNIQVNVDGTTIVKDGTSGELSTALKVIKVIPSGTAGTDEVVDATLSSNVKEAYRLVYDGSTTAIGKQIEVYKDSSLKSVQLGNPEDTIDTNGNIVPAQSPAEETAGQSLNFVYHLADGTYQLVQVDVSKFLTDSEYGDGLTVTNHIISVLIDPNSEKDSQSTPVDFLTVSEDGVKVQGIKAEIGRKIAAQGITAAGDSVYIAAAVDGTNNKKINVTGTYGVFNTPTAGANTLSATTNGIAKAEDVATAVNAVVGNLDGDATATAASGDVYTVLTSVTETDGVITKGGEVTLAAVAKTGAAADVTVAADQTSGLAAGNVQDTLEALKTSIDGGLDSVSSGNGAIAVGTKTNKNQSISLVIAQHQTDSQTGNALDANDMLTITNGGLNLSNVWDCGTY